jgi:parvulin-like peptidyl-prolyl isomerase
LVFQGSPFLNLVPILIVIAGLRAETAPLASYRDGVVTREDVLSWQKYLEAEGRSFRRPQVQQQIAEIVALRALGQRFESLSPDLRQDMDRRYRLWQLELAQQRLRDVMRTEAAPSEAEIRAVFEANPAAYGQARAWVLANIFKRYPPQASEKDKARVRRTMEEIRRRAVAGEDFPTLARQESDSETRLRGGSLGAPSLDRLAPSVADVVSRLKAGEMSLVFEVPGGLALVRCTGVIEPKEPTLDDARPRIARPRGEQRFQKAWAELTERADAELAPTLHPEAVPTAGPQTPVASFREGAARRDLTREEFDLFLAGRGLGHRAVSAERLRELLAERVRLERLFREAEARGLLRREGDAALSRWKALELRARAVEQALPVPEPAETELRAAFEAGRASFVAAPRSRLEALKLRLRPDQPRDFYEDARKWGERLAAGDARFDEAVRALSPPGERVDLEWLDDDQVWLRGLNFDTATKSTPAGGTTRLVQEGRDLFIVHVLAREPERPLSFDEAREAVRSALRDEARQKASTDLRRRVVEEQRVVPAQ